MANLFQGNGLSLEGGGVEDVRTGFGITALQVHQGLGIVQDPFLGAAALGHTGLLEVGAGGTVQNQGTTGKSFDEFFSCKHGDNLAFCQFGLL